MARTRSSDIRMVAPVAVPDDPKPLGPDSRPLMTREEMQKARKTLVRVREMLAKLGPSHTFIGGWDSVLWRVDEDFTKVLDEIERLWRRHGR